MTTPDNPNQANANDSNGTSPRRRFLIGLSAFAAIGTAVATTAVVSANTRSWHGGSAEEMADHIEHRVEHILAKVDATQEQKEQIASILKAAATDIHTMHDQHRKAHQQLKNILSASAVNRSQLETIRMEHLALADDASKRLTAALADAADLLTPEQRLALAEHFEKRRHGWHHDEE